MSYYFPKWLLARMITIRECSDPLYGSSWAIRTPRLVPCYSDVLVFASLGNITGLQVLFSQGLASPFDVGNNGDSISPLFVSNNLKDSN